jgi:hypothetical protein
MLRRSASMSNSGALWLLGWLGKEIGLRQMVMSIDTRTVELLERFGDFFSSPTSVKFDWRLKALRRARESRNDSYYTKHKTHHVCNQPTNQSQYPAIHTYTWK